MGGRGGEDPLLRASFFVQTRIALAVSGAAVPLFELRGPRRQIRTEFPTVTGLLCAARAELIEWDRRSVLRFLAVLLEHSFCFRGP